MKKWTRKTCLNRRACSSQTEELWQYWDENREIASFQVDVTVGKPLDVMALKGASLQQIRDYANLLQRKANELYAPDRGKRDVSLCPCCEFDTDNGPSAFSVFGVAYQRCFECGHTFVRFQPEIESLTEVFADSEDYSVVYTDKKSLEVRLNQVIKPKLAWVAQTYRRHRQRELESVLDVGAGGGHFIEGCRRAGMKAEGYEISKSSRRFAKEAFGLTLRGDNFLEPNCQITNFDVMTFWGLLEYTPEPRKFIEVARRHLDCDHGMLIIEVPRIDCVSSAIQKECPATVARHLDPTTHVNCFSDASLATVLFANGFKPVAAWYFGMDAYELFVQAALQLGISDGLERLAHLIPGMQASFDESLACDDIVIAAVPLC